MHFGTKSYLKSTHNHTAKHAFLNHRQQNSTVKKGWKKPLSWSEIEYETMSSQVVRGARCSNHMPIKE